MGEFKPFLGIDLGATFSVSAYIDENGKPVVIPSQENRPITPSVVSFSDSTTFLVGEEAVNRMIVDRENTVSFVKRFMGDPNFRRKIHGEIYTPQKISAFVLKKLKNDAEAYFRNNGLDIEVSDAVITVPAYFGMEQRGATKEAGELAGLNIRMIMNEPTAAALAYGLNKLGKDQTILVFNLGGYTFDVTILEVRKDSISIIALDGDHELGGKDWDDLIVDHCSEVFKRKHGSDPRDDPDSYQQLYDRAVLGKKFLSKLTKTKILVHHDSKREYIDFTREKFEELSKDLIAECAKLSNRVLEEVKKPWKDIDATLLVGGSTYMPMIKDLVRTMSGKEPADDVSPDQCVAIGAAYQAWHLSHPRCGCQACEEVFRQSIEIKDCCAQPKENKTIRPKLMKQADIDSIEDLIVLASRSSKFAGCLTLYDLLGITPETPTSGTLSAIDELVKWAFAHSVVKKNAILSRLILIAEVAMKKTLIDSRDDYNRYLLRKELDKVYDYFMRCTDADKELQPVEKRNLVHQFNKLGISDDKADESIRQWMKDAGVNEVEERGTDTTFVDPFGGTCYEILGVAETASQIEIQEAYDNEYRKALSIADRGKADARRYELAKAFDCLKEPIVRKRYEKEQVIKLLHTCVRLLERSSI